VAESAPKAEARLAGGEAGREAITGVEAVTGREAVPPVETGPAAEAVPSIPASAGAMICDRKGRLLILKPTYKAGWTIPGGVIEADGETPWEACQREVAEECGLTVRRARLACVDFRRPRPGRTGGMRFLFDCGRLDEDALASITVQPDEISQYRIVKLRTALPLLSGPIRRRVKAGISAAGTVYLEEGRPLAQVSADLR
jgi:8-oxo-dGTP diphosphatase